MRRHIVFMVDVANNINHIYSIIKVILLEMVLMLQAASSYMHNRLMKSSLMISNMIGPVEKIALADHPIKGVYFMVLGIPQVCR